MDDVRNFVTADGLPICPVCGKPIQPTDNRARPDGGIVHVWCWPEVRIREDPCKPRR
jgi:hypothetical protein